MEISDAIAILLKEDSTDPQVMEALSVCLKLSQREIATLVLRKGLEVYRAETLAKVVHVAMEHNPSLRETARTYADQKTLQERDAAMRQKIARTIPSEPKKKP